MLDHPSCPPECRPAPHQRSRWHDPERSRRNRQPKPPEALQKSCPSPGKKRNCNSGHRPDCLGRQHDLCTFSGVRQARNSSQRIYPKRYPRCTVYPPPRVLLLHAHHPIHEDDPRPRYILIGVDPTPSSWLPLQRVYFSISALPTRRATHKLSGYGDVPSLSRCPHISSDVRRGNPGPFCGEEQDADGDTPGSPNSATFFPVIPRKRHLFSFADNRIVIRLAFITAPHVHGRNRQMKITVTCLNQRSSGLTHQRQYPDGIASEVTLHTNCRSSSRMTDPPLKALSLSQHIPPNVRAHLGRAFLITVMTLRFLRGLRLCT